MNEWTILLPTRPQPDTLVAVFLLKKLGSEKHPGIENAKVEIRHTLAEGETFESLLEKNIFALDLGGGVVDHHGKDECTAELVADYLGVRKNPALARMLGYARRDDKDGKGTLSTDALDRAFGLSGLISALNKLHTNQPDKIASIVFPLLEAQYESAYEHHVELPRELEEKKKSGMYSEVPTTHKGKKLTVASVVSDKPSMPTFLRSQQGPHADVVLQKLEHSNHFCILTRQERNIDLSNVMALIRLREAELGGITLGDDEQYLKKTGRIDEIPFWYFDPATNSLLNGGAHNKNVEESKIPFEEMKRIVAGGLKLSV